MAPTKRVTVWAIVLGLVLGLAAGVGSFTFVYAKGYSYITNDPAACANCHVMADYYNGWMKGSHRSVAVCNDCHTPHSLIPKYMTKASNGFWHSFYFTTGWFPDTLPIKRGSLAITEHACRRCHTEIVQAIEATGPHAEAEETSCLRCHNNVGHMQTGFVEGNR